MNYPSMENSNKIFIGGLPLSANTQKLSNYFSQFGTVKDCVLMVEKETSRSRGFGFVIMEKNSDVTKIL